ncbi:hypothetical protein JQ604_17100 [Bradyrhizobium jicamae]|uniref:DUF7946 domain-containing protein n=1 Tax=Bradyrhizobium jicamae TaxID=280332 RepID=UPI001BA74431|nr:hypothetical protein [Bradyrhizobium jicamae]MBR0753904.1 hypothetical protein [Bradyrhizobium jicamae]
MDEAEDGSAKGARQAFQVAYHGDDPDDHTIDVEALVPALRGFDRLVRESNAILNGDRSRVRVVVASNFEHKCFHINFDVIQHAIEVTKTFLQDDYVKTAKNILQLIGVIRSVAGNSSLLDYLKWKKNNQVETIKPSEVPRTADGPQTQVTIQIVGGEHNTINVHPDVLKLAENPRVLNAVKDTLAPIEMHEAARVEFRDDAKLVSSIDKADVRDIVLAADAPNTIKEPEEPPPETVVATLFVYSPVFDEKAERWRFVYGDKHIYADISETSIGSDAWTRGGSFRDDRYRVRMEVTPPATPNGDIHYKVVEVLEFTSASQQPGLPLPVPKQRKRPARKKIKKTARTKPKRGPNKRS